MNRLTHYDAEKDIPIEFTYTLVRYSKDCDCYWAGIEINGEMLLFEEVKE